MTHEKVVVHDLMVNRNAFAILVKAIQVQSLENLKFETLREVVTKALDSNITEGSPKLDLFEAHLPLEGDVRVYLRLKSEQGYQVEAIKSQITEHTGKPCSVRDAVVYCAFLMADQTI